VINPFQASFLGAAVDGADKLPIDKQILERVQNEWVHQLQSLGELWQEGKQPPLADKRFSNPAWAQDRLAGFQASSYLAHCTAMVGLVDALMVDSAVKQKIRFSVQQWLDAVAPSNFLASNPEALQLMQKTQGKSLAAGLQNLLGDLQKGKLSQTDEQAFEVGRNVGSSSGAVVFENELVQLIQYQANTSKVGERPILLVPPCINKFYILDLQPENSLVQHLVTNGHTVYMVSWRNVAAEQGHLTWDDYLQLGVVDCIQTVQAISKQEQLNLLGFCVGGTILATALAALKAKGQDPCASLTLLTTFLDFSDTGALGLMVDENFVAYREKSIGQGGLLKGQELATTFSFLRPNDLVWNYVVSNYLKGEAPPAFDLLYWNGDSTNLPGPMYAWYLRNTYFANLLRQPDALQSLGEPINLGRLTMPTYVLNTRDDHIVPWTGGYQTTQILAGPVRFVLGASGHIAGVVNSAIKNKRSFWVNDQFGGEGSINGSDAVPVSASGRGSKTSATASKSSRRKKTSVNSTGQAVYPADSQQWFASATETSGSWWHDWTRWLDQHKGAAIAAPKMLGNKRYKSIEPAPGRYVKAKAS
jgi:polyhydroxyalkanoate synthase subunit PhaC